MRDSGDGAQVQSAGLALYKGLSSNPSIAYATCIGAHL